MTDRSLAAQKAVATRRARAAAQAAVSPTDSRAARLREAVSEYVALDTLSDAVRLGSDLFTALRTDATPEARQLVQLLTALVSPQERTQIKSPADVAALLMVSMAHLDHEELRVVILDTKNRVMAIETVYSGSLNSALVRVGEVFKAALRLNAATIILCHNHPSGSPDPSPEDIMVTRQIVEAGKLLDVEVLDHLIVAQGRHTSMRERGLGFSL